MIGAQVLYPVRHRLAETLADVLLRRAMAAYGPKVALDLDLAAKVAQTHLGWSGERAGREYNPRDLHGMQPQEFWLRAGQLVSIQAGQLFVRKRRFSRETHRPSRQGDLSRRVAGAFARSLIA